MTIVRKINTKNESEDTEMERKVRYDRKATDSFFSLGQHLLGFAIRINYTCHCH
ncbi:hypothetical protein OBE_02066, partial [human gut metagenome]